MIFNIHSVAKLQKNEGGTLWGNFFLSQKSHNAEKTEMDPLVSPGIVCYTGKTKILFGSVPLANGYNLKLRRTFGRTILVTSDVSKNFRKNLTKPKLHLNFGNVIIQL